jgi:IS5 family transposase
LAKSESKITYNLKKPCTLFDHAMYKHNYKQLEFEDFALPFNGGLRSDNRWVKIAKFIPWDEFESLYSKSLSGSQMGSPALSVRIAIGALIIKERLGTSDEETVEQIRENPYLQYFLGFKEYKDEAPFHPTMFVHFRKRIGKKTLAKINAVIGKKALAEAVKSTEKKSGNDKNQGPGSPVSTKKGKLLVDATCAPADITFPTDMKILNTAREKSEEVIDILHRPLRGEQKKPRTYRKKARKEFLSAAKSKKLSKSKRRKAIRKQLGYLRRNLKTIGKLNRQSSLTLLTRKQYKNLLVIDEVYRQQKWMFDNRQNKIADRIVSVSQPHVRPIKRGKAGATTEFGAKISASLVDGFAFVDRIGWDNYNEAGDLKAQIVLYHDRFGFYPQSVHADKIYRNRDNRKFCKKLGIRLSGPALGRPPKQIDIQRKIQAHQDELDRIPIEGKFGQAKRRFSLSKIMCKLAQTSETAIAVTFIVVNIERWLKAILFCLFFRRKSQGSIEFWLRNVHSKRSVFSYGCILQAPESAVP